MYTPTLPLPPPSDTEPPQSNPFSAFHLAKYASGLLGPALSPGYMPYILGLAVVTKGVSYASPISPIPPVLSQSVWETRDIP